MTKMLEQKILKDGYKNLTKEEILFLQNLKNDNNSVLLELPDFFENEKILQEILDENFLDQFK